MCGASEKLAADFTDENGYIRNRKFASASAATNIAVNFPAGRLVKEARVSPIKMISAGR